MKGGACMNLLIILVRGSEVGVSEPPVSIVWIGMTWEFIPLNSFLWEFTEQRLTTLPSKQQKNQVRRKTSHDETKALLYVAP